MSIVFGSPTTVSGVVVLLEVGGEIGGGGVGVVTADGVKDGDPVFGQLLGGDGERIVAGLDEAALHAVVDVGELHAAVTERAAAVAGEHGGAGAHVGASPSPIGRARGPCTRPDTDDFGLG